MSRWKSPQAAAKRAEHAAKEAGRRRGEKRNILLLILGVGVVSISLLIADYFWMKARAQKRHEEHMQSQHHHSRTNPPARVSPPQQSNMSMVTNHE